VENAIVIIPTYNEKENIEAIIRKVFSLPVGFDILIIDDGSPDGTAAIVRNLQSEFPGKIYLEERKGKLGLGTAYIHGFKYALRRNYKYICEMDADFSHNPKDLVKLYTACAEKGYDLAIGSRYVNGVTVINWPIGRVLMSYYASAYVRLMTGMPISGTTAGFKCYKRKVLETINLDKVNVVGYGFQIKMKFLTWKYGFRILEVPIIFKDRTKGQSKMSGGIFKEAVFGVLNMKIKSFFEHYNAPNEFEETEAKATMVQSH
jgi:dolichol-phosphate mannosyltransferase